jgi:hypothetical protein
MNIFNLCSTSVSTPMSFDSFYCEAGWRIGDIAANSASETSVIFNNCQMDFSGQNPSYTRGLPAYMLGGANQPITLKWIGGVFSNYWSVISISFASPDITFDGTQCQCQVSRTTAAYKCLASNATSQGLVLGRFNKLSARVDGNSVRFDQLNADTLGDNGNQPVGPRQLQSARPFCACYHAYKLVEASQSDGDGVLNPRLVSVIAKTQITGATLTNSGGFLILNFKMPSGCNSFHLQFHGPSNGDVLWDDQTGSVFFVRSVAGTTITAVLQNNFKTVGGVAQLKNTITLNSGNFYVLNSRVYTPTQFTQGNFSTTSPNITGVGDAQGTNSWVTADIKVGDIIYNDDTRSGLFRSTNGTLGAVTASQLTMANNANQTANGARLGIFIRTAPANSTVN